MLYTLGAYDRFNFGDLLYPHLLEEAASRLDAGRPVHCGISAVDMRPFGGHEVLDLRSSLAGASPGSAARVVVGGGEVIGASWFTMLTSLSTADAAVARRLRHLPRRVREEVARRAQRAPWRYPFVPAPRSFRAIAYCSVGASHTAELPRRDQARRWRNVAGSDYVSVRDSTSKGLARAHGVRVHLAPDAAAALFSLPRFQQLSTTVAPRRTGPTVVVQASRRWVSVHGRAAAAQLRRLSAEGVDLVFLPVGLAPGHSDREGLTRLARAVGDAATVASVRSVSDIVAAICRSDVVVASSLHVNVVAMAAGRPHVGLPGVTKLASYLSTWALRSSAVPAEPQLLNRRVLGHIEQPEMELRRALAARLANLAAEDTVAALEAVLRGR